MIRSIPTYFEKTVENHSAYFQQLDVYKRQGIADIRRAARDDRFFDSVPGFGFLSLRVGGFRPVEMRESMLRGNAGAGEQCQQGESCE